MLPLMYELPDHDNTGVEYVIDERAVREKVGLMQLKTRRKESA
jgi:hypothetical protein